MAEKTFYELVPKILAENLAYRLDLRRRAAKDSGLRRAILTACKHDILFLLNAFAFLFEPRPEIIDGRQQPHVIPFITWPHQDIAILEIEKNLGYRDMTVEKSRGEGGSWIVAWFANRDLLFDPMAAIGISSRNEAAMDNSEDPDSLMWKISWGLTQLPSWMVPQISRNIANHTFHNSKNGSTIAGYAATGDMGSGGRKKWWGMDELSKFPKGRDREAMASTQHVTNCRLAIFTPKGSEGAAYDIAHEPGDVARIKLRWQDNPTRNRGLYTFQGGRPVADDPINNPLPPQYNPPNREIINLFSMLRKKGFKLEERARSPWYDKECNRFGATPQNIAQELDLDYGGSVSRVFGHTFLAEAEKSIRPVLTQGMVTFHPETLQPEFDSTDNGDLKLWLPLDAKRRPPKRGYNLGVDISNGVGGSYTSNSVVSVIDRSNFEQVAEFAVNTMPPTDFADFCIALAKWFHDGYLIWEANGSGGSSFGKRVLEQNYGNIYWRTKQLRRSKKRTYDVGWWSDPKSKGLLIHEFSRSVRFSEFKLASKELLAECGQYIWDGGEPVHEKSQNTIDQSAKGAAHGDRVIAAALAWHGIKDRPVTSPQAKAQQSIANPPYGTLAWREKYHSDLAKADGNDWDDRTTDDLAAGGRMWKASW